MRLHAGFARGTDEGVRPYIGSVGVDFEDEGNL